MKTLAFISSPPIYLYSTCRPGLYNYKKVYKVYNFKYNDNKTFINNYRGFLFLNINY